MNFFRLYVGRQSGKVRHVMEQDTPFDVAGITEGEGGEELDVVDVGFVVRHTWTVHAPGEAVHGKRCAAAHHIWTRIGHHEMAHSLTLEQARDVLRGHPEMPKVHDSPCSIEGMRERIRRRGVKSIPAAVRVWLTATQPPHVVDSLGIAAGVPLSAIKAAVRLHLAHDPHRADFTANLEREIQKRSDADAARRLAARNVLQE